jgi:RNA recognition motif-containing protein
LLREIAGSTCRVFEKKGKTVKIFVANFDSLTSEDELDNLFSKYGSVRDVKIWVDVALGENRGFGFVEMPNHHHAKRAIRKLNGEWWRRRQLRVSKAHRTV